MLAGRRHLDLAGGQGGSSGGRVRAGQGRL